MCGQYYQISFFMIVLVTLTETLVNAYLGWCYCQRRSLNKIVEYIVHNSEKTVDEVFEALRLCGRVVIGITAIFTISQLIFMSFWISKTPPKALGYVIVQQLFAMFSNTICVGVSNYLCGIWIFENWGIHIVGMRFAEKEINKEALSRGDQNQLGCSVTQKLLQILDQMDNKSNEWKINHMLRFFLTTTNATICLLTLMLMIRDRSRQSHSSITETLRFMFAGWLLATAIFQYLVVFLTALVPGFVSDKFFDSVQCRLFDAGFSTSVHPSQSGQRYHLANDVKGDKVGGKDADTNKAMHKASMLMNCMECLHGRRGMHFAGFPMTLAQGLTVGSVLSYIVVQVTATWALSSSK